MRIGAISLLAVSLALPGCMGAGSATNLATANAGINNFRSGPQIVEADLEHSCAELTSTASALYARHSEIVAEAEARERERGILAGAMGLGIGLLGNAAMANAGGLQGMRTVATATQAATIASDIAIGSTGQANLQEITDVTVIAQRAAQIERAKLQKGCT